MSQAPDTVAADASAGESTAIPAGEPLVRAEGVWKIFGPKADQVIGTDDANLSRRELQATGGTTRRRTIETSEELTAQEAVIARLARDGLSNPEIGGRLFISARTVQYHLHKVFAKLNVNSRSELAGALGIDPQGRL